MALIATRIPEKPINQSLFIFVVFSIAGIITSLFSLYFSYVQQFDDSKSLLVISMGFTIVTLVVLFIIMNFPFIRNRIFGYTP